MRYANTRRATHGYAVHETGMCPSHRARTICALSVCSLTPLCSLGKNQCRWNLKKPEAATWSGEQLGGDLPEQQLGRLQTAATLKDLKPESSHKDSDIQAKRGRAWLTSAARDLQMQATQVVTRRGVGRRYRTLEPCGPSHPTTSHWAPLGKVTGTPKARALRHRLSARA